MDRLKFVREKLPMCEIVAKGHRFGIRSISTGGNKSGISAASWRAQAGLHYEKARNSCFDQLWSYVYWHYDVDPSEIRADRNHSDKLMTAWKKHAAANRMAAVPFPDADVALSFLVWVIQDLENSINPPTPTVVVESNYMMERNARHWDGDLCALNAFEADHDATEQFIANQKAAAEAAEEAERQRRLNTLDDWDLLPDAEPENSIVTRPK